MNKDFSCLLINGLLCYPKWVTQLDPTISFILHPRT
jgi:hypothetical protein